MLSPKISVLMPLYNGESHITDAIDSILSQTFKDFELVIINDGSTDSSRALVKSYNDRRIHLIDNQENLGLSASLNLGLNESCGQYIARMDCDDISLPNRLEVQFNFMENNPEITTCGSWVKTIGHRSGQIWNYPMTPDEVKCQLLFECPLAHPTVIFRAKDIRDSHSYYDESYQYSEDYEFWIRLSKQFSLANIGEILLLYRCHNQQFTTQFSNNLRQSSNKLRASQLEYLGVNYSTDEVQLHQQIGAWQFQKNRDFIQKTQLWLYKLNLVNQETQIYPQASFSRILGRRWFVVCLTATCLGLWIWKTFWQSPLSSAANLTLREKIAFGVKCGVKFEHRID